MVIFSAAQDGQALLVKAKASDNVVPQRGQSTEYKVVLDLKETFWEDWEEVVAVAGILLGVTSPRALDHHGLGTVVFFLFVLLSLLMSNSSFRACSTSRSNADKSVVPLFRALSSSRR